MRVGGQSDTLPTYQVGARTDGSVVTSVNQVITPLSKSLLLPMSAYSAREMSLAHHLALAACRGDSGNRHQINELVLRCTWPITFSAWGLASCRSSVTHTLKPRSKTPSR